VPLVKRTLGRRPWLKRLEALAYLLVYWLLYCTFVVFVNSELTNFSLTSTLTTNGFHCQHNVKPGTEWVQAVADISHSALCCHSNETRAPIANLPNSAQLEGTPSYSPKLHPSPCSSVGMWRGTDIHRDTQTRMTTIHFTLAKPHAKCNNGCYSMTTQISCDQIHWENQSLSTANITVNAVNVRHDTV